MSMKNTTSIFARVPAKNPRKLPVADFKAVLESCLFKRSPMYAPKNGPIMIPNGPKKTIPIIKPKVEPHEPPLVPPNTLVP